MASHHDQVEFSIETDRSEVAEDPFDVRALARLLEHPGCRIESAQSSRVTGLASAMQHGARAAADIKHGARRHYKWQVEVEVASSLPRAKQIVQRGEAGLSEQAIDHRTAVSKWCRQPQPKKNCI